MKFNLFPSQFNETLLEHVELITEKYFCVLQIRSSILEERKNIFMPGISNYHCKNNFAG